MTQVLTLDGIAIASFDDGDTIQVTSSGTVISDRETWANCTSSNAALYQVDALPDNWFAGKFTFDGSTWAVTAEAQAAQDELVQELRQKRDNLLDETDWWATSDRTMTQAQTDYRQALRDITDQAGFPTDVTWPEKP